MPSGQAGMQLPLPLHTEAQRAAGDQIDNAGRGFFRVRLAEPGRRDHRARPKTRSATCARLGNRLTARPKIVEIPSSPAVGHAATPLFVGSRLSHWIAWREVGAAGYAIPDFIIRVSRSSIASPAKSRGPSFSRTSLSQVVSHAIAWEVRPDGAMGPGFRRERHTSHGKSPLMPIYD
jgi:hypothetical protein